MTSLKPGIFEPCARRPVTDEERETIRRNPNPILAWMELTKNMNISYEPAGRVTQQWFTLYSGINSNPPRRSIDLGFKLKKRDSKNDESKSPSLVDEVLIGLTLGYGMLSFEMQPAPRMPAFKMLFALQHRYCKNLNGDYVFPSSYDRDIQRFTDGICEAAGKPSITMDADPDAKTVQDIVADCCAAMSDATFEEYLKIVKKDLRKDRSVSHLLAAQFDRYATIYAKICKTSRILFYNSYKNEKALAAYIAEQILTTNAYQMLTFTLYIWRLLTKPKTHPQRHFKIHASKMYQQAGLTTPPPAPANPNCYLIYEDMIKDAYNPLLYLTVFAAAKDDNSSRYQEYKKWYASRWEYFGLNLLNIMSQLNERIDIEVLIRELIDSRVNAIFQKLRVAYFLYFVKDDSQRDALIASFRESVDNKIPQLTKLDCTIGRFARLFRQDNAFLGWCSYYNNDTVACRLSETSLPASMAMKNGRNIRIGQEVMRLLLEKAEKKNDEMSRNRQQVRPPQNQRDTFEALFFPTNTEESPLAKYF